MIGTSETQVASSTLEKLWKGELLPPEEYIKLCGQAKPIISKEANVVSVKAPVTIVGDVHGQFWDLLEIFKHGGSLPETNYLFLGDYVNRGCQSVECAALVLALKVQYPEKVTLLRGNHECRSITKIYGFYEECQKKFSSEEVYNAFHDVFDCLPLAATVGDQYFCVHGGLSAQLENLDSIKKIDRFQEVPQEGLVCDLLWADPSDEPGFVKSARGVSATWGPDISKKFNADNGFKAIIRAHMFVEAGYSETHDKNVVTVFSVPNYCYKCGNKGAIMKVEADFKYSFIQYTQIRGFEAAPECEKTATEQKTA